MAEVEIKTESLPQRCDICHQADCFDPTTGHCSRCAQSAHMIKSQDHNSDQ